MILTLSFLFFLIAVIYSSVGFGGGSSYLALLSMTSFPLAQASGISLFCNLIVSGGGVWHFSKAGQMRFRFLMPFLITSVPAAYAGGLFKTDETFHRMILGLCLLLAAWRIAFGDSKSQIPESEIKPRIFIPLAMTIGGLLGFLSGFLGIGGGIFLSPILILTGWSNAKESSAAASLFIFLNSLAGLAARGPVLQGHIQGVFFMGLAVFIGGQMGSRAGAYHLPAGVLRKILAGFVSWAGFRLLWAAL